VKIALLLAALAAPYDLVIQNGRVMDPESGLDAPRHIGITKGVIQEISEKPLEGKRSIDARGLVVAPGFVDLHRHGQTPEAYELLAQDGVTSALELEVGVADIDAWYAEREGKALVNYGASIGHIPVRMKLMGDPGAFLPAGDAARRAATDQQIAEMKRLLAEGLERGAPAVGFGIAYTGAASRWEILEMFRVAARHGAACHVHVRSGDRADGLQEVIAAAAITGAPLHIVHVQSSGGPATKAWLEVIAEARSRGLDVSTECYPYAASQTRIESALYDGWENRPAADYQRLQWVATGERLTRESFLKYRKQGGSVISHSNTEAAVRAAVAHPLAMIASDGGRGHPRSSGTFARILGRYTRENRDLTLMEALRKMTLMPAQRLERRVP